MTGSFGALIAMVLAAQAPTAPAAPIPVPTPPPAPAEAALPFESPALVRIETGKGTIVVAVATREAPVTAANFLAYVDEGRLDGVAFYRVVKVDPGYGFVQFGVNGEADRVLPPIAHEPTSETGIHHVDGTLSVARREPGTAQGEFTIMLGDQRPGFDARGADAQNGEWPGYAAFGRVVEGMDVVEAILDLPVSPTATVRGVFQGQVPTAKVRVLSARRIPQD